MCSRYINAIRATRLNVEKEHEEIKLRELQMQEDKTMGIWAKRQLRTEQQIATKQSPLQRARRIRNKRQEEINRIHSSIANGGTEHKTSEKRLNSCHSKRESETRLVKPSHVYEEDILSSSISLPSLPARRNSLPKLSQCSLTMPAYNSNKRPSLPIINGQIPVNTFCKTSQPLSCLKLPPLK